MFCSFILLRPQFDLASITISASYDLYTIMNYRDLPYWLRPKPTWNKIMKNWRTRKFTSSFYSPNRFFSAFLLSGFIRVLNKPIYWSIIDLNGAQLQAFVNSDWISNPIESTFLQNRRIVSETLTITRRRTTLSRIRSVYTLFALNTLVC